MTKTYIIAETACSHDGQEVLARTLIDAAGQAKSDAVQLQIWDRTKIITPNHTSEPILASIELSKEVWASLIDYARATYPEMEIIACVYSIEDLHFVTQQGVDVLKIHASDIDNFEFLIEASKTGKRIDLSIGGCQLSEISRAIETIKDNGTSDIWLMYGIQNFPTPAKDINLNYMQQLEKVYQLPVGYQDHSEPESLAAYTMIAAAIGSGVNIIEKHITHDRALKGIDHQAALNPDEYEKFVAMIRDLDHAMTKKPILKPSDAERKYKSYAEKTIVAAQSLPKGTHITREHLAILRSDDKGLTPRELRDAIGRKIKHDIEPFTPLSSNDLE